MTDRPDRLDRLDRLRGYRDKRDFAATPEPAGNGPAAGTGRFVVQRHRARRRHYDLRLELDGVLVSWAVPNGPSLDPAARQLAVHVEDHPIEYADFEGVIPRGEYGGGDVIVWDTGRWQPARTGDPARAIAHGELHFDLAGDKLAGRFVLTRTARDGSGQQQWLLIHKNDEHARPGWNPEDHPQSVKTGRTNAEVAAAQPPSWDPPTADELAALDGLGAQGRWSVAGRELALTNLDKPLFPAADAHGPVTKRDLVRYHAVIAPYLLPYLFDRPVNMHRYPDGVDRPGFWHKEAPEHAPGWITTWHNPEADPDDTQRYFVVDSVAALAWMANFAAVELHPWTSALPDVHQPTWALIDIDPGTDSSFDDVLVLARLFRDALTHLEVDGIPKVTGQRGIQIWVPVAAGYRFDDTRSWVEKLSRAVGRAVPDLVSWKWEKDRRKGLARLDYTQNAINKTLVVPFSARPAPGAPVSVPIGWDELDDPDLAPDRWTVRTVSDRVRAAGDPLAALIGRQQKLPPL